MVKYLQCMSIFLQQLWDKTRNNKKLTVTEKILWPFLLLLSCCYRVIFFFINRFKLQRKPYHSIYPVVSVGNISLGGTGKSVFVHYLMHNNPGNVAVLLRGYGGQAKDYLLVSDGHTVFAGIQKSGDEAYMLAQFFRGPVVVGKNRAQSCKMLEDCLESKLVSFDKLRTSGDNCRTSGDNCRTSAINFIILDDAYQHHSLYKNLEILLLDARYPFENGYCVPAGRLREKDISRAQVIILTHANLIVPDKLKENIAKIARLSYLKQPILTGKHKITGLYTENKELIEQSIIDNNQFFVCAGIGSWQGFLASVKQAGVTVRAHQMFEDHNDYSLEDIAKIQKLMVQHGLQHVITTEKDWYKIKPLLSKLENHGTFRWHVLRVTFEFLSEQESVAFKEFMKKHSVIL